MNDKFFINEIITKCGKDCPQAIVAYIKDEDVRRNCTSGGFFTALAEYIVIKGGIVWGATFNKKFEVVHDSADSLEQLVKFSGSKYVQSNLGDCFIRIEKTLKSGRLVLFSGTPCQVEGLLHFLGKSYQNLLTVDIFCHGVGSPKYWKKYLDFMQLKYQSKIVSAKFRDKTYGYNSANQTLSFANDKVSCLDHDSDYYWSAFSKCYIFRPSCYNCCFKQLKHRTDFTIGDYWNNKGLGSDFAKSNGLTLVLMQSDKSVEFLLKISYLINYRYVDLCESLFINGGHMITKLLTSSPVCNQRESFFRDMDNLDLDSLYKKYLNVSFLRRLKSLSKPLLYKIGLLSLIKR